MTTTSTQQTNGANTLIVSSPLMSFSSASVNSSALAGTQQSLIAQNQLAQQPGFLQVLNHDAFQPFYQQQQQMFLQPQTSLTLQQSSIQTAANDQAKKRRWPIRRCSIHKKINKL